MKNFVTTVRGAVLAGAVAITTVLAATNASATPVVTRTASAAARSAATAGAPRLGVRPDCLACVGIY